MTLTLEGDTIVRATAVQEPTSPRSQEISSRAIPQLNEEVLTAESADVDTISHPRAGRPVTDLGSVTVVGPDLAVADAYATALYAMGPLRARAFSLPEAYEFLIITDDGRGLSTPGFSHYAADRLAG